jgi:hypothetical protein
VAIRPSAGGSTLELLELLDDELAPAGGGVVGVVGGPVVDGDVDDVADGGPVVDGGGVDVVAADREVSGAGSSSLQAVSVAAATSTTMGRTTRGSVRRSSVMARP